MEIDVIKQISVSFENKEVDQEIARFIKSKKKTVGVSEYIKRLVSKDMNNVEGSK